MNLYSCSTLKFTRMHVGNGGTGRNGGRDGRRERGMDGGRDGGMRRVYSFKVNTETDITIPFELLQAILSNSNLQ